MAGSPAVAACVQAAMRATVQDAGGRAKNRRLAASYPLPVRAGSKTMNEAAPFSSRCLNPDRIGSKARHSKVPSHCCWNPWGPRRASRARGKPPVLAARRQRTKPGPYPDQTKQANGVRAYARSLHYIHNLQVVIISCSKWLSHMRVALQFHSSHHCAGKREERLAGGWRVGARVVTVVADRVK